MRVVLLLRTFNFISRLNIEYYKFPRSICCTTLFSLSYIFVVIRKKNFPQFPNKFLELDDNKLKQYIDTYIPYDKEMNNNFQNESNWSNF